MLHIVLYQPDIPQNTGNIGRLCAIVNARLHLIHPLGFEINDRQLRRSGMDYWKSLNVYEHANWEAFASHADRPKRLWAYTTKGARSFWSVTYQDGDGLLFGKETAGLPDWLHELMGDEHRLYINQYNKALRSLNLSTSVGIATYEALRQIHHHPL